MSEKRNDTSEQIVELPAPSGRMPYKDFLAERQKIVEARQRAQQRTDQLVTSGAGGALVLSITFLEKIAPHPEKWTSLLLVASWGMLLIALLFNLISHFVSQRAFDDFLAAFDQSFRSGLPYELNSRVTRMAVRLARAAAAAFVVGVGLLATFAFVNVTFT